MDWIKLQVTLPRSPKVMRLARLLGCSRQEALGIAVDWLCWLDGVTEDGKTGLTAAQVDELFLCNAASVTGCNALCDALVTIGWAEVDENGEICAVDFEEHNGKSAKKRVQTAERVRKMRKKQKKECNASSVTKTLPDKIREDIYNKEGNLSLNTTVCSASNVSDKRARKPLPESAEEVQSVMAAQAVCGLRGEELEACAQGFWDDMEACGWTARNGAPLYDWVAAMRKYLNSWQRNGLRRGAPAPTVYRSEQSKNYDL